ncbi:hypothetical protein [Phormidesmis priestleyi]|uniref:COG4705 family protein n=1 Tax=Phormidesmis priestleyi TaxID=268141 RepID=UPI00083A945A|nr:hypothetical protein [Phormidesmis priestleyi]
MRTNQDDENSSLFSKVPEVTIYFWIIKILCTTVGETASDFLNVKLGLGLNGTSIIMGALLLIALFLQFKTKRYLPALYWLTVVLVSIFGTLVTDNLTDQLGVPLQVSTTVFSIALALTFAVWFAVERTLSIHSIFTWRRESFYWLAVLVTFALGTASGDLLAESLGLGYFVTGLIIAGVIAFVAFAWSIGLNPVLSFWLIYIMTRPLGFSGSFLSQAPENGGLGLGATVTSAIFLVAILLTVIVLSLTKHDAVNSSSATVDTKRKRYKAPWQIALALSAFVITVGAGYYSHQAERQQKTIVATASTSPLGDLSSFRTIAADTLSLVQAGKLSAATERVGDLEVAWDNAQSRLKAMNPAQWSTVDTLIDHVLKQLRAKPQDPVACKTALDSLIAKLDALDQRQ